MKDVGEPCAGEPHARFDGEGWKRSSRYRASPSPNQPRKLTHPPFSHYLQQYHQIPTEDSKVSTTGVVMGTYEPAGEIVTGSFARE